MQPIRNRQPTLFDLTDHEEQYLPRPVDLFRPRQIILAKGSVTTPKRRFLAERICVAYPSAEVVEQFGIAHNKIDLGISDPLQLHYEGRRTLVLGEHNSAVGCSDEEGNTCPNFWHFSPYGYCPYGCSYCYLAGTQGVRFSPTVKVFMNLDEILAQVDRQARKIGRPEAFYLGKLQDGMALDPLTGYSRVMIPFFARHPFARLRVLSKSADFDNVLDLDHGGHTVLCWSLNPPEVRRDYEVVTPPIADRIEAMRRCAAAGYPIRVMLMPIIPIPDWRRVYGTLLEQLLAQVRLDRITLGGVCSYGPALNVTSEKLGSDNAIVRSLTVVSDSPDDGRARYSHALRAELYSFMRDTIRRYQPKLTIALCMESHALTDEVGLAENIGKCNCIL
ncbi:MAG: radical SAM protein [Gemmataceae bacterium]